MSWQDRDYAHSYGYGPTQRYGLRGWSVTTWLIAINVIVFVLDQLFVQRVLERHGGLLFLIGYRHPISEWGAFTASAAIKHLQLWRFITFQFLHANLWHVFFNMLALYFFGPLVEQYLGSRRYTGFYLLCGIAGAAAYLVLWKLNVLIGSPDVPLVGASAGIFGILVAAARIAPDAQVMLLFPPIPMRLKTLAWVMLGIAVYTVLVHGSNAGGQAAHLGGAALGALLMRFPNWLDVFNLPLRRSRWRQDWNHQFYR